MSIPEIPNYETEKARTAAFFEDPASYAPIELVAGRRISDCLDPRGKRSRNRIRTSSQTAGGQAGNGVDHALAVSSETGQFMNIYEGIEEDARLRVGTIGDVHHRCRFLQDLDAVLDEMSDQSDQTKNTYERWVWQYQLRETLLGGIATRISDASKQQLEFVRTKADTDEIISLVDSLHPDHSNVAEMEGENRARFWVDNHTPHLGLNRQKKHREAELVVQGYHNSLAATKLDIQASPVANSGIERRYKMAALFLRSAATRTILGNLHNDTVYLDVRQSSSPSGLEVVEVGA